MVDSSEHETRFEHGPLPSEQDPIMPEAISARLTNLGAIAELGPELNDDRKKIVWAGTIGPESRLANGETDVIERSDSLLADTVKIESYFIESDENAPEQCIDGRRKEGAREGNSDSAPFGPKEPGGTAAAALAYRIVENPDGMEGETIFDDLENMLVLYEAHGLRFGAHIDDHAKEGFTGCGAIDKMPDIMRKLSQFEANPQVRFLAKAMLDRNYNPDRFNKIAGRLIALQAEKATYLDRQEDGEYGYREAVIEVIKDGTSELAPVEKLIGTHNEIGLVINTVPNTTFDRDRFSADHNDEYQLFDYDIWRTLQLAETLYPVKPLAPQEEKDENYEKQQDFITMRVMYAAATAMVLTDGSVRLLVRN